jgi:hypothetical protein
MESVSLCYDYIKNFKTDQTLQLGVVKLFYGKYLRESFELCKSLIKTLPSSTIIEDVSTHCKPLTEAGICYYYFDFNDSKKQLHESLIRSLIIQLSLQSKEAQDSLFALSARCKEEGRQQLTSDALASTFRQMIRSFQQVFIILDA